MSMALPVVAIVGRANVGKSTLFNRIVGERISIVENVPGVTRDRIYAKADWNGKDFHLIDTGGIELDEQDEVANLIRVQAEVAIDEAEVIVFLVDGQDGLTGRIETLLNYCASRASQWSLVLTNWIIRSITRQPMSFTNLGLVIPLLFLPNMARVQATCWMRWFAGYLRVKIPSTVTM